MLLSKTSVIIVCLVTFSCFGCVSEEYADNSLPPDELSLRSARYCNVCKNGGQITNLNKKFVMENPQTGESIDWTCGFLAESLADVLESGGAPGEGFLCDVGQLWAKKECACSGKPLPESNNNIHSSNPSCDLCLSAEFDFKYEPEELRHQMAPTRIAGEMPCGGLYKAAALGVFTSKNCVTVRNSAGPTCCNIPAIDEPPPPTEDEPPPPTENDPPNQECDYDGPSPGQGFVLTNETGGKIHAVYGEIPSKYCHVIDPGEWEMKRLKQGWGKKTAKWNFDGQTPLWQRDALQKLRDLV